MGYVRRGNNLISVEMKLAFDLASEPLGNQFFLTKKGGRKNNFRNRIKPFYIIPLYLLSCLEPYNPPVTSNDINILVVDGFINSTAGVASVRLSTANALSNPEKPLPETAASVTISTSEGDLFELSERDSGYYAVDGLLVESTSKYRVNITTSTGGEYVSDYIELKKSPALTLSWEGTADGVDILVNTGDPTGKTQYYRWDYLETWQYRAVYDSYYKLVNAEVVELTAEEKVYNCWSETRSTSIMLGSSVRLSEDIISNLPIMYLPKGSDKLAVKYSILVRQSALSKEEFDFWQQLKKTTESLGGLFDPQPTQVLGNIHNANNSSAPVLGYFSGGAAREKRIFIDFYDLPDHLRIFDTRTNCTYDTITSSDVAGLYVYERLINTVPLGPGAYGYSKTLTACADCTTYGGTTTKPTFWE